MWYKERDGFWLDFFNDHEKNPGWSCKRLITEQTLFEFTLNQPQGDRADHLESVKFSFLLAWSDDCDMAGQEDPMMLYIQQASHHRWKVKEVSADFMLGVRRTVTIEDDDVWVMKLTMVEFIDGVVAAYKDELAAAGWANASPDTPVPKGE